MKALKTVVAAGALALGGLVGCAHSQDTSKEPREDFSTGTGGSGQAGQLQPAPYAPPGSAAPSSVSAPGGTNYSSPGAGRPDTQSPTDAWQSTGANDSVTDSNTANSLNESSATPYNTPASQPTKSRKPTSNEVSTPGKTPVP